MFVYLSKKIAIPNNINVNCIRWSTDHGWIAVGGEDGLLKILKLDSAKESKLKGANLSMNQTLEGHSGQVKIMCWNEQHQKLTSSDDSGLIIVWMLHKGTWYEEMVNNRNKSIVSGVAWNNDGQKICIVYEDGAVIVGSVDGSRIWGKEFKKLSLMNVQWSPDSKFLLFGVKNGEVHVYDEDGNFSIKVRICCLPSMNVIVRIINIDWYNGRNGYYEENCPVLAIVYQSGHIQLMRHEHDDQCITLDTAVCVTSACWSHDGSILAVAGTTFVFGENNETNLVQFFNPYGEHIRSLKLPGNAVTDCSWEGGSLRLAVAVDSFLYFANIRPDYGWCYFADTVVFAIRSKIKAETIVTFWDTKRMESYQKTVKSLLSLASFNDHCVLAATAESTTQYLLMVCNSLTTVIDCKYMDLKPSWISMNSTHIFAASPENFIMWHYLTPKSRSSFIKLGSRLKKERLYHVDDTPSGVAEVIQDLDKSFEEVFQIQPTRDPICCIASSDKILLVGRRSGIIQRYTLPQVSLIQRISCTNRPQSIALNCDSTKMSVIDFTGLLSIVTLDKEMKESQDGLTDRKDVWNMKWASDNPDLLAVMEKTRMYVLRNGQPEEPIGSSAYIAKFDDLQIKAVMLDEIVGSKELNSDFVIDFEIKSLRDTRQLLEKVGIPEAISFIEKNSHPKLWKLLAEAALQNLDFSTAESAYVKCTDYAGIQLIRKLNNVQNDFIKKALIASYFSRFDEAEKLYLKADRRDLAIGLREKLGDWFRVVELMKAGSVTSDSQLNKAWNNIGDFFMEKSKWASAKEYYQKAGNYNMLIKCYQYLEDYEALESCIAVLPEGHPLLEKIAEILFNVGMCPKSVAAYIKFGAKELAVEISMKQNHWDMAMRLASDLPISSKVNDLFSQHVTKLLKNGRTLDVIQLYRKADKHLDAADLMFQLANDEKLKKPPPPPLMLKKMYTLVGLLTEDYIKFSKTESSVGGRSKVAAGIGLDSATSIKLLDDPWHYAEAYHFLMLAQTQLTDGNIELALRTSVRLRHYDDVLDAQQSYSVIATCAIVCNAFDTASKAFTELETLDTDCRWEYENMALKLFSKNIPKDSSDKFFKCTNCSTINPLWEIKCQNCNTQNIICVASGQIVESISDAWQCNSCKHFTSYTDIISRNTCPLCHHPTKL